MRKSGQVEVIFFESGTELGAGTGIGTVCGGISCGAAAETWLVGT